MGGSLVVYSQCKIINFVSKDCVPYLLGMINVKFHNHSSSSLSATKLTLFQENVLVKWKGQRSNFFERLSLFFCESQTIL